MRRPIIFGDGIETFIRREDAERFIEEVHGDDPELASYLRVDERELHAGGVNPGASRTARPCFRVVVRREIGRRIVSEAGPRVSGAAGGAFGGRTESEACTAAVPDGLSSPIRRARA